MNAPALPRLSRLMTSILPVLILAGCGQGDGPEAIVNQPATPLPDLPAGFCDPINFDIFCPVGIVPFAGGDTVIVENPAPDAVNDSETVAETRKRMEEVFGGVRLDKDAPYDFANGEAFTFKVRANRAVPVTFKLEQQNVEEILTYSDVGNWEELCAEFPGAGTRAPNNSITIIFDATQQGQAATDPFNWTFYFDDITQVESCPGGGLPANFSTITFDDPNLSYRLSGFGGADDSQIVADPDDAMNQVARVNRAANSETFAGTTVSLGPNQAVPVIPVDAMNTQMSIRVRAPGPNIPVRLKIADAADPQVVFTETEALTTATDAWETLTFDLSMQAMGVPAFNPAIDYNQITVFFNFGATNPAQTFYFDDIAVVSGSGGPGPGAGDHGPGTGGVFTETTTETTIAVAGIVNSADFSGNNTVADPMSTAIPAFEGGVVLAIDYQDSSSTFGGALFDFGGVDLTAFETLNFTIDTSAVANLADLTVQIEPPGAGAAGTNVALSAYTPVATSGNWNSYQIPLADFTATTFSAADNLGFWNPRDGGGALVFGTIYVDDIYFSTENTPGPAGHGPGTGGVFTETTTESTVNVAGIVNSADFSGNNTVADPMSTAIPAFEGAVSLSIDYQDSSSTFGGALFDFGEVDLTAFNTLNFTIDTSAVTNFGDLTIQIEPPGAGAAGTNVALSAYTPVATSGNWNSYQIPLADFTATNFAAADNLGFWNMRDGGGALVFGTIYVDDIYFSTESTGGGGGSGGGGGGAGGIAINGGFEDGNFTGWTQFEATPGDQTVNMGTAGDTSSEGSFHLEINNTATGTNSLIKQERVGLGTVTPGIGWTVTFDARGSLAPGGVAFAQVFSETAAGNEDCTGCGILGGAPLALDPDPTVWTSFSFSGNAGPNTESLTLQLEAVTGGGNLANVFYDNITIVVN